MFYLICSLFIGLNIVPLLIPALNIWQAQGLWVQFILLCFLARARSEGGEKEVVKNIPLSILFLWCGVTTLFWCYQRKSLDNSFWFMNVATAFFIYTIYVQYLNPENIRKVISVIRWTILGNMFLCVLQLFGYSQFFAMLIKGNPSINNPVVGMMGQPTHLAGFLAMCSPIFLYRKTREDYLALILMGLIIFFYTGTTKDDPSMMGIVVLASTILYYLFNTSKKAFYISLGVISMAVLGAFLTYSDFTKTQIFDMHGRKDVWFYYIQLLKNMPITGLGLGYVALNFRNTPIPTAMHVHLEMLQIAIEIGLIGLISFLALIKNVFCLRNSSKECIVLKSILLGFIISGFFNWSMHLWLSSMYALFAYGALYAIENERINYAPRY